MNVLDENLPERQRALLRRRRFAVQKIGQELGRKGTKDEQLMPFLLQMNRPTFFTLDQDFYGRDLCHERYCLVFLDVDDEAAADYIGRFLRHPEFSTRAKRLGRVIRVLPSGIRFFAVRQNQEQHLAWN